MNKREYLKQRALDGLPPLETTEQIKARLKKQYVDAAAKVPKETQQRFLDLLHAGKSIGEAKDACGITELMVACEIIDQNIVTGRYLRREVQQ